MLAAAMLVFFGGATLLLSELRWFRRRPLVERLAPYCVGAGHRYGTRRPTFSSWHELMVPLARWFGDRLARCLGVAEPAGRRLERVHSPSTVGDLRLRQLAAAGAGFGVGALVAVGLRLPGPPALTAVLGCSLLGFWALEQRLASVSRSWQRSLASELPVVAEQLGMLLGAGYSLGAALGRLADRGKGACGSDLRRVVARIHLGLSEADALREWAELADVPSLHRLVGVLALNRDTGDLAQLVADEARHARRDLHRNLVETVEKRAQQVWIPVTVAALVPGAIFLAVPFVEALRLFSQG